MNKRMLIILLFGGALLIGSLATTYVLWLGPKLEKMGTNNNDEQSRKCTDEFQCWWQEYKEPSKVDYSSYPEFYRGAWAPRVDTARQYLIRANELRAAGVDSIMLEIEVVMDPKTGSPRVLADDLFIFYIQALKKEGFRVFIILNPAHPNFDMGKGFMWGGEGSGNEKYKPGKELIDSFTPEALRWAKIAKEQEVFGFLPLLEPHVFAGDLNLSSEWLQEILPQIKKVFPGKIGSLDIMYKSGSGCNNIPYPYNYSGYDFIVGGPPAGWKMENEWKKCLKGYADKGLEYLATYKVGRFGLYEWGGYQKGVWYEDKQICDFDQCLTDQEAAEVEAAGISVLEGREAEGLKLNFSLIGTSWTDFGKPAFTLLSEWYLRISPFKVASPKEKAWKSEELVKAESKLAKDDYKDLCRLEGGRCKEMSESN